MCGVVLNVCGVSKIWSLISRTEEVLIMFQISLTRCLGEQKVSNSFWELSAACAVVVCIEL